MATIKINVSNEEIRPKVSSAGTLILPDDAPDDVKEWVKNG